jgi:hypothetical protein
MRGDEARVDDGGTRMCRARRLEVGGGHPKKVGEPPRPELRHDVCAVNLDFSNRRPISPHRVFRYRAAAVLVVVRKYRRRISPR